VLLPPLELSHPHGSGIVIFEVFNEGEATVCGIRHLEGHLNLPPKQWLKVFRSTLAEMEARAKAAGCTEMRMSGRDWSRILPDYEHIDGDAPNLLRKRLT
jgi:hypothetical protein